MQSVVSGQGVTCMPQSMVALQIERGELVRLYPQMEADHLEIILVRWRDNRNPAAQQLWTRLRQ